MDQPLADAERKIQCVRDAVLHHYPTADMGDVLRDIAQGRLGSADLP
jgi:hypothetical protein